MSINGNPSSAHKSEASHGSSSTTYQQHRRHVSTQRSSLLHGDKVSNTNVTGHAGVTSPGPSKNDTSKSTSGKVTDSKKLINYVSDTNNSASAYSSNVNAQEINESILKAKEKLAKKPLINFNLKNVQEAQRQYYQNK
jgi:hypothetical protein